MAANRGSSCSILSRSWLNCKKNNKIYTHGHLSLQCFLRYLHAANCYVLQTVGPISEKRILTITFRGKPSGQNRSISSRNHGGSPSSFHMQMRRLGITTSHLGFVSPAVGGWWSIFFVIWSKGHECFQELGEAQGPRIGCSPSSISTVSYKSIASSLKLT